ncbi:MAG TPA: beta-galactosidase trimerization domain-containing protein [Planctomycetota bacterium]|nr:beta-galactosidase trimerization domain-containing protein [Planctomycetota bacterium]
MRSPVAALVLCPVLVWAGQSGLRPDDVPTFQLRARVVKIGGEEPGNRKFTFRFGVPGRAETAAGNAWSEWLKFELDQVVATLKGYPAIYMRGFPVVVKLVVGGAVDPTVVEAELKLDETGETKPLRWELFGGSAGFLLWRDEAKKPQAATMADYNQRYWKVLATVQVPEAQRPKHFPIVERFIGGDDDRLAWQQGIEQLARGGFSVIMLPPSKPVRDLLLKVGLRRTAWAVYNPPGYAFDYDPKVTPAAIQEWADKAARAYLDAGYAREDMAIFAMSDEPGWYYPSMFRPLAESPAALARFRDYVRAQGLRPRDVGAKGWDEVLPLGRSLVPPDLTPPPPPKIERPEPRALDGEPLDEKKLEAELAGPPAPKQPPKEERRPEDETFPPAARNTLANRRLFYWTMRFYAWDSARHFAVSTRALEKAFWPGMPILTNWNFFSGRFCVPGPVANNADKQSPDAAMGGHDWLEFGRLRGGTMLWTEDWFSDAMAPQWSFYCAKLRCAAEKGGVAFGGYVIPRTAGDRADGILQKILCVVGSGGKAIKYFVFGPEYNFPGNCYSENARVLPKMAEAHAMIGAAEDLLWPGKRPRAEVAILMPRSAQPWDAKAIRIPNQIHDATNNHLNRSTVDYMAEVYDLYLALQHANIPVDFVDEDDLTRRGLAPYKVLYVTEPNIPEEGQRGIASWARAGGTLVTVSGAGARGRYDEPCSVLRRLSGIEEEPRERMLVGNLASLKPVGKVRGEGSEVDAIGVRGTIANRPETVEATFDDGSPAIVQRRVGWWGRGRVVHFAWMPGLSYAKSASGTQDRLPVGFSAAIRRWIAWPTELAGVQPPVTVDRPMVESPLLVSDAGAAVTLLNWTGEPLERLRLTIRVPFAVRGVESVKQGKLAFEAAKDGVVLSLPLGAADILMLRP